VLFRSIRKEYHRLPNRERGEFKHFVVSRSVTFLQSDLDRFDEIYTKLVSVGDLEIRYNFDSSEAIDLRWEARIKAVKVARKKAGQMAEALEAKLGIVLTISEHIPFVQSPMTLGNNQFSVRGGAPAPSVDQEAGSLALGTIDVRVSIYVTFEIE